ncbi:hypothetical protein P153DRAFT_396232 [Dothidotthia symphoricarpi CBS 119687]|uniref:Uncharacterized protein n=1 Tax=Dothidotthia symphoricarpi CBS 119687 TaxID=1392245 RepID=A0A6A6AF20_9PLEO|nr:uncharacterized protein P153DRAFT_396232 [Dothidotthia symphoricarpi CBS 119687]KAF2129893.1 hypothetical protein P153DRAFT_396232 [Dothidotthia symphoricarpi CBS 119687]
MRFPLRLPGSSKKEDVIYCEVEVDPNESNNSIHGRVPKVAGWPTVPRRVGGFSLWIVADLVLLLMPIAFIVLAVLAYRLDREPISDHGKAVKFATTLGPTVFPLVFAALGGRSLKKIALWKAERGTTLGALEHLIGSQSLVAAFGHAVALHSVDILSLSILVLWMLSPLGGQSALRLMHETNSTVSDVGPVYYADVNAASAFPSQSDNVDAVNLVSAVVSASLATADTSDNTTTDAWVHPKIPRLAEIERDEARNATERPWMSVADNTNLGYASLTGINVMNLRQGSDSNFTIPAEYMHLGCELKIAGPGTQDTIDYLNGLGTARHPYYEILANGTDSSVITAGSMFSKTSFFIYGVNAKGDNTTGEIPSKLLYGANNFNGDAFLYECSLGSVLVEAEVTCRSASCVVERLRRLSIPRADRNATAGLPWDVVNVGHWYTYFTRHIPGIAGTTSIYKNHPIDNYVYGENPWSSWGAHDATSPPSYHNWTTIKAEDMSKRLTRVLNTYWDSSRWMLASTRNDPYGTSSLNTTTHQPFPSMTMKSTDAVFTRQITIYKANIPWVVSLIACSLVLLVFGAASLVLSLGVVAPDIFDYVSSFTRDNPYIAAPVGGSGLDGVERARLLKRMKVQLGDVDKSEDVGYIALRSVDGKKDCEDGRIKKERTYR